MAKTITIKTKDNKEYLLEFTRKTVVNMSRAGFQLEEVTSNPIIAIPQLFEGAFKANHPYVKSSEITDIYNSLGNKEDLLVALIEMYQEPINALVEEPDEESKKSMWEVNG